jgi:hypothetical protein
LLLEVALRLLCTPATSAPSERVFSVARITIAKDRARLAPQTANELIILHDVIPAIRKYVQSCMVIELLSLFFFSCFSPLILININIYSE